MPFVCFIYFGLSSELPLDNPRTGWGGGGGGGGGDAQLYSLSAFLNCICYWWGEEEVCRWHSCLNLHAGGDEGDLLIRRLNQRFGELLHATDVCLFFAAYTCNCSVLHHHHLFSLSVSVCLSLSLSVSLSLSLSVSVCLSVSHSLSLSLSLSYFLHF